MNVPLPKHDPRQVEDDDGSMVASWERGLQWRTLPAAMGRALTFTFRAAPRITLIAMGIATVSAVTYAVLYALLNQFISAIGHVGSIGTVLEGSVLTLVVTGGALLALRTVSAAIEGYLYWKLHNEVFGHADMATLRAAVRVPLEKYEDSTFYALLQRCSNSVGQVSAAAPKIVHVLGDIVAVVAIALALSITNKWLIIVALGASVPALVTELWSARRWYRVQASIAWPARLRYYLKNVAQGRATAAEIRAFELGDTFESWSWTAFRNMARPQESALRIREVWELVASCAGALVLLIGAVLSFGGPGGLGLPALVTTIVGLTQLRAIFGQMFGKISEVADASLYLRDIEQLDAISRQPTKVSDDFNRSAGLMEPLREVSVDQVSYRYPGAHDSAISNISMSVQAGELVAIVGRNGSGKTTLAKILAGLLPPTEGTIRWNDLEYDQVSNTVRRGVTMQFQEPTRWCFTARENVWLGDTTRADPDEDIRRSIQRAQLEAVTRVLPEGIDTRLGKELGPGSDLSGGQWRRLALARCFFRDSQIVILDEPTSAFDAIAESNFLSSIRQLLDGRAGVLITHRFSSLKLADTIYVLDDGDVVQRGTHDELIHEKGIYADLYRKQLENLMDTAIN